MGSIVIIPSHLQGPMQRKADDVSDAPGCKSIRWLTSLPPFLLALARAGWCSSLIWTGTAIRRTMPASIGNSLLGCDFRRKRKDWVDHGAVASPHPQRGSPGPGIASGLGSCEHPAR